jgi:hypothetical protein
VIDKKYVPLALLLASCLVAGLVDGRTGPGPEPNALATLGLVIPVLLVFCWYRLDAADQNYDTSWGLSLSMAAITVIAVPWYLFRSRGAARGALAVGGMVVVFVAAMLCYRLGTRFGTGS